jgi:hypothetical protein
MDCKPLFRIKGSRTLAYSCSTYLAVCLLPGSTWLCAHCHCLSLSFQPNVNVLTANVDAMYFVLSAVNLSFCV